MVWDGGTSIMDVGVAWAWRATEADVCPPPCEGCECAVMAEWAEEGLCAVPPMLVSPRALAVDLPVPLGPAAAMALDRRIVP